MKCGSSIHTTYPVLSTKWTHWPSLDCKGFHLVCHLSSAAVYIVLLESGVNVVSEFILWFLLYMILLGYF